METTCLYSSTLPSSPFLFPKPQKFNEIQNIQRKLTSSLRNNIGIVFAAGKDSYEREHGSLLVDESMILLRKRIHEMKMIERNYEPPEEWMEWEKQCYTSYNEFVCKVVGLLQSHLINSRPCLALGMIALITMSVPASMVMIASRLIEAANTLPIH